MRNYLIIVEGAHDISVIQKLLRINGVDKIVHSERELPPVWRRTIPDRYPFHGDRLERISPIPSFVKNEEISVAIKNAGSDSEIMNVLVQTLKLMDIREVLSLDGIMLVCDADEKNANDKRKMMLDNMGKETDYIFHEDKMTMLFYGRKEVEVYTYIFPDNDGSGNLENLLIDTAKIVYPQLLDFAEEYVGKAATIQTTLMREQDKNKAIVGCITNVMKPGKANQVSIADNDWVSERTIEESEILRRLNQEITKMCRLV